MLTTAPAPPTSAVILRALEEFQLTANEEQVLQIQQYIRILLHWNDKLNLTAIRDPLEILYRHFCESMYAAAVVPVENGRLADVGSGGGFPGLALKILRPDLRVFLIESSIKKVAFLAEVTRELGLKDVQVLARRYEELGEEIAPLDFVCSRALGEFPAFLDWGRSQQIAAKQVILWIGARDLPEIQKIRSWDWGEPIQVPHSLRRLLLVGTRGPSLSEVAAST
jgi:16S rRNA (guanine527-N7)-methyltransferase